MTDVSATTAICVGCQKAQSTRLTAAGRPRVPMRWKVIAGQLYCAACRAQRYRAIAITCPVAGPLEMTWAELGARLTPQWQMTTAASNWIAHALYSRDVPRTPDLTRLPAYQAPYLYPEVRERWPGLAPQTVIAILQRVQRLYAKTRLEIIWHGCRSVTSYNYPQPLPVHEQSWSLECLDDGRVIARVRIGAEWVSLRLTVSAKYRAIVAGVARGAHPRVELLLVQIPGSRGDHRGSPDAEARRPPRLLAKIVTWCDRPPVSSSARIWHVQTSVESLVRAWASDAPSEVWALGADHVRRVIHGYERRQERLQRDLGVVRRWRPGERDGLLARSRELQRRHRDYMRTALQTIAAQIVDTARRRQCGTVSYDDLDDGYLEQFPWYQLRSAIQAACGSRGVQYVYETRAGSAAGDEPGSLAITGSGV